MAEEQQCPNCGAPLAGRFCSMCGQERVEAALPFIRFAGELFREILDLDARLGTSLRLLLFSPGALTADHLAGRRARHVQPLRLYLTILAAYLLLMFLTGTERKQMTHGYSPGHLSAFYYTGIPVVNEELQDTTMAQYRLRQSQLPPSERDGVFRRLHMTLAIKNYEVGLDDDKLQQLSAAYVENTPKVLFVLVPVLALILTLFFRQSGRLFVEHAIFSLHIHAFIFALVSFILVLTTAITALAPSFIPAWSWYGRSLAGTGIIITYGYLALRRVYGVSRLATATKSLVVFVVYMAAYVAASIANICLTIILT